MAYSEDIILSAFMINNCSADRQKISQYMNYQSFNLLISYCDRILYIGGFFSQYVLINPGIISGKVRLSTRRS